MNSTRTPHENRATRRGDVFVNQVTGEQAVVLLGTQETAGARLVAHLTIAPGGAVNGAHQHPNIEERFRVLSGEVGFRVGDSQHVAPVGEQVLVAPGVIHDWWNAGPTAAQVIVDIRPGARFEQMIKTSFGLANAARTNAKGMPGLLQLAVIATEFRDTIVFTSPPPALQRALFTILAPLGRLRGLRATYPEFDAPHRHQETAPELLELIDVAGTTPDAHDSMLKPSGSRDPGAHAGGDDMHDRRAGAHL